jgi:signal transduction histidine kinase/ligand-binding sensor domain-containing protein/DNA-binding response OmpR family regulator
MKRILLVIFFATLCFFPNFTAQTFSIRSYTSHDGLISDKIMSIQQDCMGRMWIGTPHGLCCFDGAEYTHYTKYQSGKNHISNNIVQAILPRPNGDVWFGTPDSLNIYSWKDDKISSYGKVKGLKSKDITVLASGSNGNVWLGTFGEGLFKYEQKKDAFTTIGVVSRQHGTEKIMALCEDSNHQLWIGTRYNGLFLYSPSVNECKPIRGIAPNEFVKAIFQDVRGNVWVGSDVNFYHIENNVAVPVNARLFSGKNIFAICENPVGTLWVGGDDVLFQFNPDALFAGEDVNSVFHSYDYTYKGIHAMLTDKDNNLWLGTYGEGVKVINHGSDFSHIIPGENSIVEPAFPSATYAISKAKSDGMWLGKEKGGIIRYNFDTQNIVETIGLKKYDAIAVLEDNGGNLWIGTNMGGLVLRRRNSAPVYITNPVGSNVRTIYQAKDSSVYISAVNGFFRTKDTGKNWENVLQHWYPKNPDVRCVSQDGMGRLWLGTYNSGLFCYDPVRRSFHTYYKPKGLKSNIIYDVLVDGKTVWIATDEGLASYSLSSGKFTNQFPCNDIPDVSIFAVQKDKLGNLWFSSAMGLWQYEVKHHRIYHFSSRSLPRIGEFTEGASAIDVNGNVYFGSYDGLLQVNPYHNHVAGKKTKLIFTQLIIDDQKILPDSSSFHSNLTENMNINRHINVFHNNHAVSIHFSLPYYDRDVQYYYKLDKVDNQWRQLGNQNWVTFRDLQPGDYRLLVRAVVESDHNEIFSYVDISVHPPLWATWWAKTIYLLLICGALWYAFQLIKSRVVLAHNIEIERNNRKKEEEVHEAKLMFFTNLSHELRTPLTLLLTPLEELISNETNESKKNTLKLINKSANRLMLLVNQILDFRKSEKGEMKLAVQEVELTNYFNDISSYFRELAKDKNIDFSLITHHLPERAWIDPSLIEKVCFNLLSNSFKFTPQNGHIEFTLSADAEWLTIKVTDNGMGIQRESQQSIFKAFFQENRPVPDANHFTINSGSGIGLHLVKSIAELHHGFVSFSSVPDVETVFTVRVPYLKEAYDEVEISADKGLLPQDIIPSGPVGANVEALSAQKDQQPHLLIVDDNEELLRYIQSILSKFYLISVAHNGVEALEMIKIEEYDLIVSDVMMPQMNGIDLCKYLKGNIETNYIPIILLTAKSSMDDLIEGVEIGADAYITKPFNLTYLRARIDQIIESRQILRTKFSQISPQNLNLEKGGGVENKFMYEVTEIIISHITDENLNGSIIANELRMSRTSLHRKLKSIAGISAGELIKNIRISKASGELLQTNYTISEIAFRNGFNSLSYFSQCFTTSYGMSPKEYRQKNAKAPNKSSEATDKGTDTSDKGTDATDESADTTPES